MGKEKSSTQLTLAELAAELDRLATSFGKGEIQIGASHMHVGDPFSVKIKQKLKDGYVSFELAMKLPISNHPQTAPNIRPGKKQHLSEHRAPAKSQEQSSISGRKTSPKPKKELARNWKAFCRKIEASIPPLEQECSLLIEECDATMYDAKPWQTQWVSCCDLVKKSIAAARAGDYESARRLAAEVDQLTHDCHKEYK